jgi:membrane protein EpsK
VLTDTAPEAARTRFLGNVLANVAYAVLSTAVMFWYIPFLIKHLGVAAYGLVPLTNSILGYAAIIADGISVTTLRYLSVGLSRNDYDAANIAFSTSLIVAILISVLATPAFVALAIYFPVLFQVPPGLELQSRVLFGLVGAGLLLTLVGGSFNATSLALHRFDLRNLVESAAMMVRVGSVILLFHLTAPAVWQIGPGFLLSGVLSLGAGWLICRWIAPHLQFGWRHVTAEQLREMGRLGGLMTLLRVGIILFQGTNLIVINFALGIEATGRYGALLLVAEAIRLLGNTVASVLSPAIMSRNATGEADSLRALAERSSKMIGLAIAFPVGITCGFADPLLFSWLGQDFRPYSLLLILLVAPLVVNASVLPLAYVLISRGQVALHSWTTLSLGALSVVLALVAAVWTDLGLVGVAMVNLILSVANNVLTASYSAVGLGLGWRSFHWSILVACSHAAMLGAGCYVISLLFHPEGLLTLVTFAAAVSLLYGGIVLVTLNRVERASLVGLLPSNVQKWIVARGWALV